MLRDTNGSGSFGGADGEKTEKGNGSVKGSGGEEGGSSRGSPPLPNLAVNTKKKGKMKDIMGRGRGRGGMGADGFNHDNGG